MSRKPQKSLPYTLLTMLPAGLFWLAVNLRHLLYSWRILRQHEPKIPTICVGNLTVGGTGKTPHVQLLVELLGSCGMSVAVLSRGYKRRSSGFRYVEAGSPAELVGDEALQVKRRFPGVTVAVCVNREQAIQRLQKEHPGLQVVVLDDAFQYRRVKAGLSIVLTTFDNLATKDYMLPLGRLRDSVNQLPRAEIVVVTKCPQKLRPIDFNILEKDLKIRPYQHLYFTTYTRGEYVSLSSGQAGKPEKKRAIALAGIAQPKAFFEGLKKDVTLVQTFRFADHHRFTAGDIRRIEKVYAEHPDSVIITTEKDAMRLLDTPMSDELRSAIYYQPINVDFLNNGKQSFTKNTFSYVRENKRIGHLY